MYMEAKAVCTVISIICIAVIISQLIAANFFLAFLLFIAIAMMIFGDMILGFKITRFKPLFEPTPPGKELMELQLLDGRTHFINTTKGPHGKRSFRINKEDASVINDGNANFTLHNGNRGFRGHEMYDGNVDPFRAKALEKIVGDDVKEIYYTHREKRGGKDVKV